MKKIEFDHIIRNNLIKKHGEEKFGYVLSKNYEYYYNKDEFDAFKTEMKEKFPSAYEQYASGKGGELKEQKGSFGTYPPKMACVASSSRFCYSSLRNGCKVLGTLDLPVFEFECRINGVGGISPQLDACFVQDNIFVESKCHEIFDDHKVILKEKYWDWIYGEKNDFGFIPQDKNCGMEFEIPLCKFGIEKSNAMFDIKQLLCHLMGIASQKEKETPATLLYLFFMPKSDKKEETEKVNAVFCELESEINNIFSSVHLKSFTEKNNIKLVAAAECSEVMEELTDENIVYLYK